MRRQLQLPTLIAGSLVVVATTVGLADARGQAGGDGTGTRLSRASLISSTQAVDTPRAGQRPPSVTTPPTTAPPPPPTTAPPPPPPPPTTTTAPPEPEPEPEVSSGGGIVCPVAGPTDFTDTWGAARAGHTHQGTDMMADYGTPTVAPVSGTVEQRTISGGGLTWFLHGDDGDEYIGMHLSGYAADGWVEAGTVIGYVGDSGNADGTPHLHFEYHPGGGAAANSYPLAAAAC